jgi:hypothetical protein
VAPEQRFLSFARNAEDVVLWRALRDVPGGRFVEVGTGGIANASVTRALRDRGWTGRELPEDAGADELCAALDSDEVHLLVVATDGRGPEALAGLPGAGRRPWVLVLAATGPDAGSLAPGAWEAVVAGAGYELCLFDGVSRFYVAEDRAATLRPSLSVPANPLDDFVPHGWHRQGQELAAAQDELRELRARLDEAVAEVDRWRGTVLSRWSDAVAAGAGGAGRPGGHEVVRLREELEATRATLSWRITAPLRAVQERRLQGWR